MSDLPTSTLGRTGLEVSKLGYGAMELRGGGSRWGGRTVGPEAAEGLLNSVLDAGINFIDTSPDYGGSEELIGERLRDHDDGPGLGDLLWYEIAPGCERPWLVGGPAG